MNKNILVKLLCLALACMLVLPMIVACGGGPTCVVTFDANGGIIEEDGEEYEEWDKYVAEGERIGTLPKPTRPGYVFDGWYEEEDEDFEDKIRKTTKVDVDMVLVAKWKQVAWGETGSVGSVEFDFNGGAIIETDEEGEETEITELIRDVDYNDRIGSLPEPERVGYTFQGWFFEDSKGNIVQLRATTLMTQQFIVATARWEEIPKCNDGTYNHAWGQWDDTYQMATCTQDGVSARYCTTCGSKQTSVQTPATGHSWSRWNDTFMASERTCSVCQEVDTDKFINVINEAMGGELPTLDGNAWGSAAIGCILNGNWDDTWASTFQANNSALIVTFEFVKTVYVDILYFKSMTNGGSIGYTVEVIKAGEEDWTTITKTFSGGTLCQQELGYEIDALRISEQTTSNGTIGWQEVALAVRSENYKEAE